MHFKTYINQLINMINDIKLNLEMCIMGLLYIDSNYYNHLTEIKYMLTKLSNQRGFFIFNILPYRSM